MALTPLAATDATRVLELIQIQNDEGPCLDYFRTGAPVSCPDLGRYASILWPRFTARATSEGFTAVHALPLRLREETIGALKLFGRTGRLDDDDLRSAQALADVATIGLLQGRHRPTDPADRAGHPDRRRV